MKTDSAPPHALIRRYKGKHAAAHYRRHAAYMAKRGWVVTGTANHDEQGLVVTYARRPALDPSACANASAHRQPA